MGSVDKIMTRERRNLWVFARRTNVTARGWVTQHARTRIPWYTTPMTTRNLHLRFSATSVRFVTPASPMLWQDASQAPGEAGPARSETRYARRGNVRAVRVLTAKVPISSLTQAWLRGFRGGGGG